MHFLRHQLPTAANNLDEIHNLERRETSVGAIYYRIAQLNVRSMDTEYHHEELTFYLAFMVQ